MVQVYKTDLLEEALKELCSKLEGVQGAVIVSIEGFVVAAYTPHESELDEEGPTSSPQVAAMAATLIALGERTLSRLAQGEMLRLLIEGNDNRITEIKGLMGEAGELRNILSAIITKVDV